MSRSRLLSLGAAALVPGFAPAAPNFVNTVPRPLHFFPNGGDIVVENGREVFNRPLYGLNTPFRVDAGDRPEFSVYLPGRGGNLRLGIRTEKGAKWLVDADHIVARYGGGAMHYEISDPVLDGGKIDLAVVAMNATEGLLVRAELADASAPCELICAYGGANGQRGGRDGDIGCEGVPVSQFFQLAPNYCKGNTFDLAAPGFRLNSNVAEILGIMPKGMKFTVADAKNWNSIRDLLASSDPKSKTPVVVGRMELIPQKPCYLAVQRLPEKGRLQSAAEAPGAYNVSTILGEKKLDLGYLLPAYSAAELPQVFAAAEKYWRDLSQQVVVDTPDPFINSAVPALCVAADGIWDSNVKAYMHGAVAWRTKLLGWRGAYTGDELGWHDRTRGHLMNWLPQQNVDPISASEKGEPAVVPQDENMRLARNEPALHSNGDLTRSHYDMNLPGIDVLFRHLLWTGDLDFARENWPVIERHLAWERRLFRRPFGKDELPLYEAYCCIWASDSVQYNGGGVTHSTAYNYYHNKMAAEVARLIGKDPAPYEHEAALILEAMNRELWLADRGWFAEWKDLVGLQLTHPNAALWTFYHTIDSEVPTPQQAWQMSRFIDTQMPHIPIIGRGVPKGEFFTLPTTTWMPYRWSTNNVVMAESAHTALADWQAGRDETAFRLFKGLLLDSMYMGICPGNVGMATQFDMARNESQRDFADGIGMTSRALVEGLFGVRPNALAGELTIAPGFPANWGHASIRHPDFTFSFERDGVTEHYEVESRFPKPMGLRLILPALRDKIANVTVNGEPANWRSVDDSVGTPRVEITAKASSRFEVAVTWSGKVPFVSSKEVSDTSGRIETRFGNATIVELSDPEKILIDPVFKDNALRARVTGTPGARTAFAKLQQGALTWFAPIRVTVPSAKTAVYPMTDWTRTPAVSGKFDVVDLAPAFNDKVTQIFKNDYRTPRSPYCSLALPLQGIGSWIGYQLPSEGDAIDDSGLRTAADKAGGKIVLPQGIPFQTPGAGDAKNIAFTSQWTNYPDKVTVPLTGKASRIYLLMAGSTHPMLSRFDNGEVIVTYADGSTERLPLENPTTWWPIDQDYKIDDYAFRRPEPIPLRVDLKTGKIRQPDGGKSQRGAILGVKGGSATVLDFALDPGKELKSLTVHALANETVIGLMSATLRRPD